MSVVSVVCRQVEVSATAFSLAQRSPTDCGVSGCDLETSTMRRSTLIWPLPYTQLQDFIGDSRLEDLCDIYVAVSATEVT